MGHLPTRKTAVSREDPCVPGPRPVTLGEDLKATNCNKFGPGLIPEANRNVIMCALKTITFAQCTQRRSGTQEHEGDVTDDLF